MKTEISRPGDVDQDLNTILVVEDDPSLSSTLCYNLRRDGHLPIAAKDGEAALIHLKSNRQQIDLVLLDLMLPRMPGLHVLRAMRQFSTTPVLILSARGQE